MEKRGRGRAKHVKLAKSIHYEQIAFVTTIPRICELFHVSYGSVYHAIENDYIAALKECGTYLVSFNSALQYFRPGVHED